MKIDPVQYVFAYEILGKLCYVGFPLVALTVIFIAIDPSVAFLMNLKAIALLLAIVVLTVPLGMLVGALFICFFCLPSTLLLRA